MATIVTNPNYIQVDGTRIQKGTRDIIPLTGGVRLQNVGHGSTTDILVEGTTIDGSPVEDVNDLLTFLDSQGFKTGGGDGGNGVAGVTGDLVDNTDPANPIVNNPTWEQVSGKPSTFAPSAHTHTSGQITDFAASVSSNASVAANTNKLNGIAVGATANATNAQLRDRSTHTGTQDVSTITGLSPLVAMLPETLGSPGQVLSTNAAGDGLEWVTPA